MSFSPELTALCQTQLNTLMQFDGSAQGIVYLSETGEDLFPVAVYPSVPAVNLLNRQFLLASGQEPERGTGALVNSLTVEAPRDPLEWPPAVATSEPEWYQVVLPLQEERYVLGALVVSRADRDWQRREYERLEQVAQTLTWAGLMDRRLQWLEQQLQEKEAESHHQERNLETLLHQIRNPLTAIKTFGKLLLRRLPLQDQNRSVAEGIVRESDRLQFLLQELKSQVYPVSALPASSATTGNDRAEPPLALPGSANPPTLLPGSSLSLDRSDMGLIPLDAVLDPLITGAQAIADDRDLHLSYTGLTIARPIQARVNTLRETLSNLIDNALKYTPSGGSVKIKWLRPAEHPGWQWLVISDNGPGIPAEDLPHLFERHYRGVQAQGDIPGTGLGLALAREWMEQMGGQLEVISPAGIWRPAGEGGVGAAFRLWLKEGN